MIWLSLTSTGPLLKTLIPYSAPSAVLPQVSWMTSSWIFPVDTLLKSTSDGNGPWSGFSAAPTTLRWSSVTPDCVVEMVARLLQRASINGRPPTPRSVTRL